MAEQQEQFEQMLVALLGAENIARKQAEAAYAAAVESDPVWVLQALTEVGVNSANAAAANIALVQLRKLLARKVQAFDTCTVDVQNHVKTQLINFFGSTQEKLLRRAAAGCISNLAVKLSSDGQDSWPELWNLLIGALQDETANPEIRAACCLIFGQTSAWLAGAYLRAHMQAILVALQNCVAFGHDALATEATHAIRALIRDADKKDLPAIAHSTIIPSLIEATGNYILKGSSETALAIIEDLCEIASEEQYEVLKPHANLIFTAMSSVAQNAELDKELRHGAIDLVLTYAESDAKTFRKNKQFATAFFELMVQYVTRPEMDKEWAVTYEDTTETNGSDFEAGASAMDRIAVVLRGKAVQDMATSHIMNNINSESWEMRAAALTVLTYVAEGCHKQFMKHLDMIVDTLILPRMSDEHPMVRYCACQCIAQMSTDFKPMFQDTYAPKLLPAICAILNDPVPRLRAMSAATLDQFFEELDEDDEDEYDEEAWEARMSDYKSMQPYMSHVVSALMSSLQTAEYDFQRQAMLTCMATVTQVSGKLLTPFVNDLVPIYQVLLQTPDSAESDDAFRISRQIKCSAIECTTLLASNVGGEAFAPFSQGVCQYLMSLLEEGLSNDDVRLRYILRGWTCMVEAMKSEVLPYLQGVMPHLLTVANLDCDAEVTDAEAGDEDQNANEKDSKVQIVRVTDKDGAKNVKLHTGLIEDKDLAITIIMVITQELKGLVGPWINDITNTCIKLLEFLAYPDIRDTAAETLAALSESIKEADPSNSAAFVQYVVPPLLAATEGEPELHVARQMVESLGKIVSNGPDGALTGEPVSNAAQILQEIFDESLDRLEKFLTEHAKKPKHDSDDEEEAQSLEMMAKSEDFMLTEVAETVGRLVKSVPEFVPQFDSLFLPLVARLIDPEKPGTYHRLGVCLLCDFVEHAPTAAAVHLETIAGAMINFAQSADPDVVQASMFGGGITAELILHAVPQPNAESHAYATNMIGVAVRYLLTPASREEENFSVSANAVSCILRIIEAFPDAVDLTAAMHAVASHLPVQDDKTEEIRINDRLVRWAMDPANPALADASMRRQIIFSVKRSKYMSDDARAALANL